MCVFYSKPQHSNITGKRKNKLFDVFPKQSLKTQTESYLAVV